MLHESIRSKIPKWSELATDVEDDAAKNDMFGPKYEALAKQTSRRFIKTHLPFPLMPHNIARVGAKVVYVARNPKDVAASYYHFHKTNPGFGFTEDFDAFLKYFLDDLRKHKFYSSHNFTAFLS